MEFPLAARLRWTAERRRHAGPLELSTYAEDERRQLVETRDMGKVRGPTFTASNILS
jgi:hypothetical protein